MVQSLLTHAPRTGLCQDFPLARLYAQTRTLRLADGPDAVHLASIGKLELKEHSISSSSHNAKLVDPMLQSSVGVARSKL